MILRRIIKAVAIFFGLILLLWSVVVGLIATPEVITPRITKAAQSFVRSELSIKSVDLSLFERFPNITLRVDSLRIAQTKDSIRDLLFARQCHVAINPFALLFKDVVISHFSLSDASLYVYVDSLHGPLKTFILPESEPAEPSDSLDSFDFSDFTLSLKEFEIDSAQIVVDDRTKKFYTRVENYNADIALNLSSHISDLDVATGFSNLIVWHDGDLLVKKTSLDVRSEMKLDMDSLKLSFEKARIRLNGIDFKSHGTLRRDTINDGIIINTHSSLNTPSLTEFLALIPESLVDSKDKITTQGAVSLDLDVSGLYAEGSLPNIGAKLKVEDAKAKYASRKLALEEVNCDGYMHINFNEPQESYADIKSLQVNTSEIIDLRFSGKVTNLLGNPAVNMSVRSYIDFDRFSEVFPLNEAVVCSGSNKSDLKTQFTLSDIQNGNFANLYIDGESTFNNLNIEVDASRFIQDTTNLAQLYLQAETGHMLFGDRIRSESNSRTLRSTITLSGFGYRAKTGEHLAIKDIELTMGANFDRKTSQMNGVGISAVAKNTTAGIDSLFSSVLESSEINLMVMPKREDRDMRIAGSISSQKIRTYEPTFKSNMRLMSVNMDFSMQRLALKDWDTQSTIAFSEFGMYTSLFPLPINVPKAKVSLANRILYLDNTPFSIGSSEVIATGHIDKLLYKIFVDPKTALSGKLAINAPFVNFTELMTATNSSVMMLDEMAAQGATTDSLQMAANQQIDSLSSSNTPPPSSLFLVPRRMNFVFDLNIDKARFEDATIENVEGRATLAKGTLSLDKLSLETIGAKASGSLKYSNQRRKGANVALNMSLKRVDINRIGELMPSINSMFPMLESFKGLVDCDLKANADLDSASMIKIPTLRSAVMFKGENLVLMDSETFADLSKMLMFKNKKRNLIDSIEAYALIEESKVDVLPFQMKIDRYAAVIGGSQVVNPQTFNFDYKYNVSILKSPLPFKAGVDITGDLNDFKFKVTSAKLKNTNFKKQREKYEAYRDAIK